MATFPVKYIHSAMRGAPALSGTAGTLIAVLDAFLITGFGQVAAVSVNVAGGIATATLQAGQSFDKDCIVLVEGATPAALNGEARVLTASNTSITWATTAPNGAATGSITIKVAPVGQWEKKFSDTNKAVYRSTDPQGAGFCYRVDDSGATHARLRGYESMTDVDTGSGPFPTVAQIGGDGGYWQKSYASGSTPVGYVLAADSRAVLACLSAGLAYNPTSTGVSVRGFGDMLALSPSGDPWSAALSVTENNSTFHSGGFEFPFSGNSGVYMPRDVSGLGGAVLTTSDGYVGTDFRTSGDDPKLGAFPSVVDGGLAYSHRYLACSTSNKAPRANVPGVLYIPQTGVLNLIKHRGTIAGSGEFAGRTLLALESVMGQSYQAPQGVVLLDITGPWR